MLISNENKIRAKLVIKEIYLFILVTGNQNKICIIDNGYS